MSDVKKYEMIGCVTFFSAKCIRNFRAVQNENVPFSVQFSASPF